MKGWLKWLYLLWATITFLLIFIKDGLSADNLAHVGIIVFFFFTLWFFRRYKKPVANPKIFFISWCVVNAAVVEGFYMTVAPILPSLHIVAGMTFGHVITNYLIDLAFTVPVYVFIFYVIWRLIKKYSYNPWEYALLFALGQALGDGNRSLLLNPGLLLFLPYIMINYHAMNVGPYLSIRESLQGQGKNGPWKWFVPIIFIVGAYLISGFAILLVAKILKMS